VERLRRWWRRSGRRLTSPETSLLPKILAAFIAVLALASLLTFVLETRLTRQALQHAGGRARLRAGQRPGHAHPRGQQPRPPADVGHRAATADRPDLRASPLASLIDVLGTLRTGESQLEIASVLDLESGTRLQTLPGRHEVATHRARCRAPGTASPRGGRSAWCR
jgi:hypothetical protein